jgi:hypothetical protein
MNRSFTRMAVAWTQLRSQSGKLSSSSHRVGPPRPRRSGESARPEPRQAIARVNPLRLGAVAISLVARAPFRQSCRAIQKALAAVTRRRHRVGGIVFSNLDEHGIFRRSPDRALEQVADLVLQDGVGWQPDRVTQSLGFEEHVDLRVWRRPHRRGNSAASPCPGSGRPPAPAPPASRGRCGRCLTAGRIAPDRQASVAS